jgi:hypothetical protein
VDIIIICLFEFLGIGGAYNDDLYRLTGPEQFSIESGGRVLEYNHTVHIQLAEEVSALYATAFSGLLDSIGRTTGKLVAANVGTENLFTDPVMSCFAPVLGATLREDFYSVPIGLTGYFGLTKVLQR